MESVYLMIGEMTNTIYNLKIVNSNLETHNKQLVETVDRFATKEYKNEDGNKIMKLEKEITELKNKNKSLNEFYEKLLDEQKHKLYEIENKLNNFILSYTALCETDF